MEAAGRSGGGRGGRGLGVFSRLNSNRRRFSKEDEESGGLQSGGANEFLFIVFPVAGPGSDISFTQKTHACGRDEWQEHAIWPYLKQDFT